MTRAFRFKLDERRRAILIEQQLIAANRQPVERADNL
jgi:hypothetical protein